MSFQPNPGDEMVINRVVYKVGQHPAAPGLAYAQAGRQGIVYQLIPAYGGLVEAKALKVFFPKYRIPAMVYQSENMELYSESPGLQVCRRDVLTPERNETLIAEYPDLLYAVLMPWIYGLTWFDVITDQRLLLGSESLAIAKALSGIGSGMEQRGLAHCDLSAPNVMLPFFSEVELPGKRAAVELVDVEQMYSPKMDRPDVLLAGSPGYAAHRTVHSGLWSAYADRFAGAVIIAEMLGWCDPVIVERAWGESYFDQHEMQTPCERYFILRKSLELNWGMKVAELFARTWDSQDLSSCPTFGEWLVVLSTVKVEDKLIETVMPSEEIGRVNKSEKTGTMPELKDSSAVAAVAAAQEAVSAADSGSDGDRGIVNRLFLQARGMEEIGNLKGALEVYRSAHHFVSAGSPMEVELEAAIHELEGQLDPGADAHAAARKTPFYRSLKWLISGAAALLFLVGAGFALNQFLTDRSDNRQKEVNAAKETSAQIQYKQAQEEARKQAEEKRIRDEAERRNKNETLKLEQKAKEEEQKKLKELYDKQAKYDAYLDHQKQSQLKKESEKKNLQEMYDKQAQYEAFLANEKAKQAKAVAAQKQAKAKAQQLKKIRSPQVVQLIASYNQAYNAQRGGNKSRAREYAMDFIRLYEKDVTYFKAVGKVGQRAASIYKFLANGEYSLPDI